MRCYLFTEREREIIRRYTERGDKLEGFSTLKYRLRDCYPEILIDLHLLSKIFLKDRMWKPDSPVKEEHIKKAIEIAEYYAGLDLDNYFKEL